MNASTWTMVVGGAAGIGLAVFGTGMLVTRRAPDATTRAFRSVRDAGWYHLLFGVGLSLIVFGTALNGGLVTLLITLVAIALVAVAVVRFRPRGHGDRWMGNRRHGNRGSG
jgi:hypothetical protein